MPCGRFHVVEPGGYGNSGESPGWGGDVVSSLQALLSGVHLPKLSSLMLCVLKSSSIRAEDTIVASEIHHCPFASTMHLLRAYEVDLHGCRGSARSNVLLSRTWS